MHIARLRKLGRPVAALVIVAFWGAYLWQNANVLLATEWQFDPWLFTASIVLAALSFVAYGVGWLASFRSVGGDAPTRLALARWYQSIIMRYSPGGVWHLAGRAWLLHRDRQSVHVVLVSSVIEQGLSVLAAVGALGLGLLIAPPLPGFGDWQTPLARIAGVAILAGAMIGMQPAVLHAWLRIASWPITVIASRIKDADGQRVDYSGMLRRLLTTVTWQAYLAQQLPYLAGMLFSVGSMILIGIALGADPGVMLVTGPAAFTSAWLAGFIILFTPGGIGARELVMTLLLEPFIGPGPAIAVAALSRVTLTAGELITVGLAVALLRAPKPDPAALAQAEATIGD